MLVSHSDTKLLTWIIGLPVAIIWLIVVKIRASEREDERLAVVASKYSGETAELIAKKMFWRGQTAEQLRDSLGPPAAIDVKLLKTRRREVWKYGHYEANRYRTRVTLDNDIVTTWTTH